MVRGPQDAPEVLTMKFRRRVERNSHFARETLMTVANLVRIAVDENNRRLIRNQDIALIHVAQHVSLPVQNIKREGTIKRRSDKKRPISVWEEVVTMGGAIEDVNFLVAIDAWHEQTNQWAARLRVQCPHWPSGNPQQLLIAESGHAIQFLGFRRIRRPMVQFCDDARVGRKFKDGALTATPKPRSKGQ